VIITSLTTVLGTLPLVFETGAGSQMYRGLAIVVVYGTIVSTPISLYGVPSLFLLLSDLRERFSRRLLRMRINGIAGTGRVTSKGGNARVRS
jgi:Cu/Ag efflux pump CusA